MPMPAYPDAMPIDISFVFEEERPAGKRGFVHTDGDLLKFEDGTPVKFWGVNFNGGACFPDKDYAPKVARRLAQAGCNLARFHQLDAEWDTPNIFSYSKGKRCTTTRVLDAKSMDCLDYFVHCLKEEGIYCYLDMNTYRKFKEGDGVPQHSILPDAAYQGLLEQHQAATVFEDTVPEGFDAVVLDKEKFPHPEKGKIRSDNGQLWRDLGKQIGAVDTPRTKITYGFLGRGKGGTNEKKKVVGIQLDGMSVSCSTDFGVIAVSSLTDDPIEKTDNMLLSAIGRARNTDAQFDGEKMIDIGKPPILAEVIQADVRIRTDHGEDMKVWGVNAEGFYAGKLATTYEDGYLCFHIGDENNPACYYLIVKE